MILTIIVALVGIISLLIIHEFGHFIVAKRCGAQVEEFGVGLPPRLLGKQIGETIYSLNLIPFGAFVRIRGEMGGIEDYRSFAGKPMWQRVAIVAGGVVSFWVVAVVILSIVAGSWGMPIGITDETELNDNFINPRVQISRVYVDTLAEQAGLKQGDTIVGFHKIKDFQEFIKDHQGEETSLNIRRGNETLEKKVLADFTVRIVGVFPDMPAEELGLMRGDVIVGFDTVKSFQEFIQEHQYQEITLNVQRGNEVSEKHITIEESLGVQIKEELGGAVLARVATKTYSWSLAPLEGIKTTGYYTANIVYGWVVMGGWALGLIELPAGMEEEDMMVMGPLGIFVMLGDFFQMGVDAFLRLVALIAVALALVNILPIPALDGGKLVFLGIEAARKKPISQKLEQNITSIFFIILITLMIYITLRFDIPRLFS